MKRRPLFAMIALSCVGCVTAPLERYTLNQSLSMTETRYQEAMNALAVVAANHGENLPSYVPHDERACQRDRHRFDASDDHLGPRPITSANKSSTSPANTRQN